MDDPRQDDRHAELDRVDGALSVAAQAIRTARETLEAARARGGGVIATARTTEHATKET